ncbi:PREDICTED: 1-phosphatidylinositol 4,5-bisphosphate phosphodiesterase eta-1 isoform X1 [Myotis brandtii]|uniref:1-phosphatidylinositol 4,5-bisphosphate phosphodiesterase eta-1 isoform X1 n=2 Tax=Myotis brandtii TaxID=109478 RepID=UPI0003BC00BA|nr:PREDICTED: 1-phosphatidylinositol 4,5-bisphosphate phosphodiesterase eta-1 isoform X1 [Myotis brandtii]XP_014401712.1 PREDICTED: 1-phosphatidylinositol 4,5-bisphosphate phosphodiesterase eta-1 isoform X1 [Myotis brandtii]XP_014401713.1 PREDICTED: 1-phosphatidylinositol 4,5-bisphosphate phosphodiesterase eta-1 isoform X1 [Myotis brandtii]
MSYWNSEKRNCVQYRRHFLVDNSVFHVERCMSVMQSGTQMIKLKRGTKGLVRLFYLDEHRTRLRWRPSRKSEKAKILIDSIYKVTEGRQSEIFHRQAEGNFDPSCCFTIYHGNHMESLDLITSNPEEARTWITGLKYLMAGISDEDSLAKRQRTHDQWVKQTFEEADKNGDGLLNIEEIHQLMHKLNVNLPRRKVRQMFQEADTDENQGTLTFEEFCVFYKMMSLRRDLYLLLLSYSDKKDHLTVEELAQFLKVEQKMNNVTTDYCLDIIRKFEVSEENKAKNVLGIEGFTSYMRSPACDIFNPLHHEVYQDMDQPLCNYYIASSHNTYLTGDQLLSQSKVDMYARVLQEGCRCVEVDCWDGPDGEPVVHHGYTLTSKIPFRDVVETINKHAFVKNEFPVILSIENHCSVQQQRKIAQYLKGIFQDKLDLSSIDPGETKQLPSPQSLKGKILVKGKKLPYHLGDDAEEGDVSDEDSADEIEDECKFKLHYNNGTTEHQVESFIRKKLESLLKESQIRDKEDPDSFTVRALLKATHEGLHAHLKQHPDVKESGKKSHGRSLMTNFGKHKQKTTKSQSKSYSTDDEEDAQQNPGKEIGQLYRLGRRRKTMKLCRELSDLVVYTNSVAAQDIVDDGTTGNVLSFSETRAHQVVQQKSEQFMIYNQKQLTRIYPSAYRIDSSNFNPLPYWNAGCQLVALNYQSEGRIMQLNRAKFKTNGNCGYVLKPQQMCKGTFNPFSGDPLPANPKKQLILKVISGQQLPKPPDSMFGDRGEIIDPFVEVEIIGLPVDCCKDQTRVVDDNGFNPVWEETLTFTVHMPEIALVRFLVWDHDPIGRDFVGQRTVTFSSLVPGYRHVYLEGLTEASIFVHITINEIFGKWSPLILNPSYTILHFLGATKNRQLQGLKGLFNKNPRHSSSESNSHYVRKRSIGDRILRRTASAPAKGRKKSKMGFQEVVEVKDSVSEAARDQDGVVRRTTRSLQVRPVSMPVDKCFLGALSLPVSETAKDTNGKENSLAEDEDGSRNGKASIKDQHFPHFSKKLSSSSSALLHKDSAVSTTKMSITEQEGVPGPKGGRTKPTVSGDGQEHRCRNKSLSPRKHLALNPAVNLTHDLYGVKTKENGNAGGFVEGKSTLSGSILSQSDLEIKNVDDNCGKGRATTSFSLSDVSTLCPDTPDLHSTEILQESDISHLIDNVTLTNDNEPGSSISALIGQFEETRDQANLTVVSPLHGTRMRSDHPPLPTMDLKMPFKHDFPKGKPKASLLCSTPERIAFLSPEASERSTHTVVCETTCTPNVSKAKLDDDPSAKAKTGATESNLPCSSNTSHCWLPKSPTNGKEWEILKNSLAPSPDLTLGDGIADPTLCLFSGESSLVEIDGDSENLSITTYDYRREGTSPLASPFKLKYSRDVVDHFQRGLRNGYCKATLHPPVSEIFNTSQDVKNQSRSCRAYQGAGFMHKHFSNSDAKMNQTCVPPYGAQDLHAPAPRQPQQPPLPVLKLPSPCKSKSLGDLTSEDIACNFESKYQCISKSFVTTGIRDRKGVAVKTQSLEPMDALTEQLRKLVSFEQEDSCQVLYAKQDANQLPRALVRKLSSRSQSRVRNIASRAKEKQEANKQKGVNPAHVGGVVLRNKPTAPAPAGNRHSTGSYIAGYLSNAKGSGVEGRGIPEGACTALHAGHTDQLCSDHSVLQTEPSSDDKPEIYFLLRL